MSPAKRKLLKRVSNAIAKNVDGCPSAECPFRDNGDAGTAQACRCLESLEDCSKQLAKELETLK